jgi:hypothetical protein
MYLVMHHLSKEMCWEFGNEMCCALLLGELFGESFTLGETMKKSLRFLVYMLWTNYSYIYIYIHIHINVLTHGDV